jgi:hypothetical protein
VRVPVHPDCADDVLRIVVRGWGTGGGVEYFVKGVGRGQSTEERAEIGAELGFEEGAEIYLCGLVSLIGCVYQ